MPNSSRGLVVVVEDDQSVRKALTRILRMAGLVPLPYVCPEDLLADAASHTPDCLVIDVQLPGITGFELYDRLTQAGRAAPVIFITAYDEPDARERAIRAGASDFLAKPFAGRRLLDAVRHAMATA